MSLLPSLSFIRIFWMLLGSAWYWRISSRIFFRRSSMMKVRVKKLRINVSLRGKETEEDEDEKDEEERV